MIYIYTSTYTTTTNNMNNNNKKVYMCNGINIHSKIDDDGDDDEVVYMCLIYRHM